MMGNKLRGAYNLLVSHYVKDKDWKDIINVYNMHGFEPHAFAVFTAFGAPLLKFMGLKGGIINLVNNRSGTGKSTILRAICGNLDVPGGETLGGLNPDIPQKSFLEMHEVLPQAQRHAGGRPEDSRDAEYQKRLGHDHHHI